VVEAVNRWREFVAWVAYRSGWVTVEALAVLVLLTVWAVLCPTPSPT